MESVKVALAGNPNSGKTTLFNALTGMRQKVSNYPGVTVERITGIYEHENKKYHLTDLPGTYSLHPTSEDERIVTSILLNPEDQDYPDLVVYVLDYKSLEQQLLMLSQIIDLGIPVILAITMSDEVKEGEYEIKEDLLRKKLGIPIVLVSGRRKLNLDLLKDEVAELADSLEPPHQFYSLQQQEQFLLNELDEDHFKEELSSYGNLLCLQHAEWLPFLKEEQKEYYTKSLEKLDFNPIKSQVHETMARFDKIAPLAEQAIVKKSEHKTWTDRIDSFLAHPILGPAFFFIVMLLVFQAIFAWATYPMDFIEWIFTSASQYVTQVLPGGWFTDLLTNGILAGLSGVLVFIPQIAILFLLLSIMEEVGYMSRAVYLFDRFMSRFGLNGRSVVAMVSGGACAIPAIMSTRTIANPKERLLTILVTPFIACSARIPVYTVLIAFVVSPDIYWGPLNAQGVVFMGLYLFGIVAALGSALLLRPVVGGQTSGFLMIELPDYRMPNASNIWITVKSKVGAFIKEAGKIIFAISIVLWVLASFGPGEEMSLAKQNAIEAAEERELSDQATQNLIAAKQIEASYAGHMGKFMEPAIKPLGFDWKIGIALLTSFAAREVFVGTMATIYSMGDAEDELRIRDKMAQDVNPETGRPTYDLATAISLLLFFALAMQCMSTLAVVKKETKSWKWPIFQFFFMTGAAYIVSLIAYQLLQ
jgi:ferrous iron transport protein B